MIARISFEVCGITSSKAVLVASEKDGMKLAIAYAGGNGYTLELWAKHADQIAGRPADKRIEQAAFDFVG